MEYPIIFERELTTQRPEGGEIEWIELVQGEDALWQLNVRVSWYPGQTLTVSKFNQRDIKVYSFAFAALRHIVKDYRYTGAITLRPCPGKLPKHYF
jgi:hypothetical protein